MYGEIAQWDRVEGGRVDVWWREDGVYGVSLLPDKGRPGCRGTSYVPGSADLPDDFPDAYDAEALLTWGRMQWNRVYGDRGDGDV
jgi:hypothetical protein